MDNKVLELLQRVYERVDSIDTDVKELKTEVAGLRKDVLRIETDHGTNLVALFDGYKANTESINRLETEVCSLKEKVTNHEIKLSVVR